MKINVKKNCIGLPLEDIVAIAKRDGNPKRNFLFLNKLTGKSLTIKPQHLTASGWLLAALAYNKSTLPYIKVLQNTEPTFSYDEFLAECPTTAVIGFAETATGLGMAVASALDKCTYFTTTRLDVTDINKLFTFKEEHSHAVDHIVYSRTIPNFRCFDEVILVDDEITTGNSALNAIKDIYHKTGIQKYKVLVLLDFRDEYWQNRYKEVEKNLGVTIEVVAGLTGTLSDVTSEVYTDDYEAKECTDHTMVVPFNDGGIFAKCPVWVSGRLEYLLRDSGRFGVSHADIEMLNQACFNAACELREIIEPNQKILILGHGENIYVPCKIAQYLGDINADFRTTFRCPIVVDGVNIKDKQYFYDEHGIKYFFYNKVDADKYDRVFMLTENGLNFKLCDKITNIIL